MSYTVLLIDDDKGARTLFEIMLTRSGFEVTKAEDAHQALAYLEDIMPDIIMTDISLPGMDGLEFTSVIRSRPEFDQVAIVVLSAHHSDEVIEDAYKAGADQFYRKPLIVKDLNAHLLEIVQKRRNP